MGFFDIFFSNALLSILFTIATIALVYGVLKIKDRDLKAPSIVGLYISYLLGFVFLFDIYFALAIPSASPEEKKSSKIIQEVPLAKKLETKIEKQPVAEQKEKIAKEQVSIVVTKEAKSKEEKNREKVASVIKTDPNRVKEKVKEKTEDTAIEKIVEAKSNSAKVLKNPQGIDKEKRILKEKVKQEITRKIEKRLKAIEKKAQPNKEKSEITQIKSPKEEKTIYFKLL